MLCSVKTADREQVRPIADRIRSIRNDCGLLIPELEACFQTPRPFYSSRTAHSTAAVNDFLANLENLFTDQQWQEFRNEDFKAGSAVVMLMLAIFSIGVVLYSIVAITL